MGELINVASDAGSITGYFAKPQSGSGPGVVVIQEWWGLVDHIKDVCDRFTQQGFVALAPDLYHGKTAKSPDEAEKMMMALRIDDAEAEIRGATDYLLQAPSVISNSVGVIGFCMGGALALYAATKNSNIGACVVFYGGHPKVKPDLPNLKAPVLGIYGERDGSITPQVVHDLEKQMSDLGKSFEPHIYPGANHAFFNDTRPGVYDAKASADAWSRTINFFKTNLDAKSV